jgi:hypothetical protein
MPLAIPSDILKANAQMEREAVKDIAEAARWTEELRRIDPSLSVVWVPEQAVNFDNPGRWHLRKEIPGDYDEWWPLLTNADDVATGRAHAEGLYKPPGSWLLNALTASDMWNPRVHRSKQEARQKHREAKRRAKERETEQRRDEMALANRAARRVKGDRGLTRRMDLHLPPDIAAEREAKRQAEKAAERESN